MIVSSGESSGRALRPAMKEQPPELFHHPRIVDLTVHGSVQAQFSMVFLEPPESLGGLSFMESGRTAVQRMIGNGLHRPPSITATHCSLRYVLSVTSATSSPVYWSHSCANNTSPMGVSRLNSATRDNPIIRLRARPVLYRSAAMCLPPQTHRRYAPARYYCDEVGFR